MVPEERFDDPGVECRLPRPDELRRGDAVGRTVVVSTTTTSPAGWSRSSSCCADADRAGVPVLGICFGGQTAGRPPTVAGARLAGARNRSGTWCIRDDPALDGAWFQWHYDRWVMPPDAVEVARNAAASQAFVLRRNLALQFHPEVDAAGLKGWLEFGGCRQAKPRVSIPPSSSARPRRWRPTHAARARGLVDTFLDRVAIAPHRG